jgi:hypothetical protein
MVGILALEMLGAQEQALPQSNLEARITTTSHPQQEPVPDGGPISRTLHPGQPGQFGRHIQA